MSDGVLNLFLQTVDHDMENLDGELQKLIAIRERRQKSARRIFVRSVRFLWRRVCLTS